jgi:membrane protease YdiL (CAAX protease family)
VPFSLSIVAIILTYVWVFEPTAEGAARVAPAALVVSLTIAHAVKTGEWGFRKEALLPGLLAAAWTTVIGVAVILLAGELLGTLHPRRAVGRSILSLLPWAGGQQFALQTVVLHEARRWMPRGAAIIVAAALFGIVHLPNPLLAPLTFASALVWCWIYSRHPNILPLAISHAVGTEAVQHAFDDDITGRLRIGYAYVRFALGE